MKTLKQFGLILLILWIGQSIQKYFGLALPGNVLGMLILLVLLVSGALSLERVERVTEVLLEHLSFLFVPSIVGVMTVAYLFEGNVFSLLFIVFISLFVVMITSGLTVQWLLKRKNTARGEEE